MAIQVDRRWMTGAALASIAGPALAWSPAQTDDAFRADQAIDRVRRSTVEVRIDGQGPFRFAVDTAATASVVADDLAARLGLADAGLLDMHTVVGRERVRAARVRTLASGALFIAGVRMAVGSRPGLIGLDGLLGLDLLAGQRLMLRFRGRRRSTIHRSRPDPDRFLGAERPRVRFRPPSAGGLGLIVVDATVQGVPAQAVIDTGAQVTLVNRALADAVGARPLITRSADTGSAVHSPTGRAAPAEAMVVSGFRFDDLVMDRLAVLAGDFHIFRLLGLADRPALLMGVDVMGEFRRVVIDLKRGEIIMEV